MLGLLFVSCKKDDIRDAFTGSYVGKVSMKGTRVVNGGESQPVTESRTGYFSISRDGKNGNRVTVKIIGVEYGNLTGSVDNDVLTIDPLHTTINETKNNTQKSTTVDLSFQPAQISGKHLILNGSLHTLTTSVSSSSTSTEDLQAALLIEADKQ